MPALVHTTFRVSNAKQFKESFEEKSEHGVGGYIPDGLMDTDAITGFKELPAAGISAGQVSDVNRIPFYALDDQMYLFIGRVSAWNAYDTTDGIPNPNINENAPPYPKDSMKDSHFNHWDDMIAAKKVSAGEVSHVIKRERADEIKDGVRNWERGKRYDTYDDRADNMFDDDVLIHTVNERFRVYKCVKQGIGTFVKFSGTEVAGAAGMIGDLYTDSPVSPSSIWVWTHQSRREPLRTDPEIPGITEDFMTVGDQFNDGYQWKYYYTIDAGEALKFVTTSYIPVRTIRKENGVRTNDYSDQYKVEEAAIPGGILNAFVDKIPVEASDGSVFGYELTGGGAGYMQCASENATLSFTAGTNELKFTVTNFAIETDSANTSWPDPIQTASGAVAGPTGLNKFDWGSGYFASLLTDTDANITTALEKYGIVVTMVDKTATGLGVGGLLSSPVSVNTMEATLKRYVFPIKSVAVSGGDLTFTIDPDWVKLRKVDSTFDPSKFGLGSTTLTNISCSLQIHPKIDIETNHQASTECDQPNSFEAYAICEPFWDQANSQYHRGELGRVIDVRVVNPGMHHYRIDSSVVSINSAMALPATSATASPASVSALPAGVAAVESKVFVCIPPIGGHGADPTGELGGFNVMINARFEGTEADEFTVGNEFRKIGILKNPLAYANTANGYDDTDVRTDLNALNIGPQEYTKLFRDYKTDQCYRINLDGDTYIVDDPNGNTIFFEPDMDIAFYANTAVVGETWDSVTKKVSGGLALKYVHGDLIATAKLVDHDTINKRIRVIKPRGDFYTVLQGTPIGASGMTAKVVSMAPHSVEKDNPLWADANVYGITKQTANTAEEPGMLPGSGKVLYVENRSMVSRSANQTEDLKISIQF